MKPRILADVSKCKNEDCTLKTTCLRYMAEAQPMQNNSLFLQDKDGKCSAHLPLDWERKERTVKKVVELTPLDRAWGRRKF